MDFEGDCEEHVMHLYLSVKPQFAEAILTGAKTLELRKIAPIRGYGAEILVYATAPTAAIVGTAQLDRNPRCREVGLRDFDAMRMACVSAAVMREYVGERDYVYGLRLSDPVRFTHPISLAVARERWGASIAPPQGYRYLDGALMREIVAFGMGGA